MKDFETFKQEILRRAKNANACVPEYRKAYSAIDFASLIEIIKNNFYWACSNGVIDSNIIKDYEEEFNAEKVYCNVDTSAGYLLASGSATVRAYGSATVEAYGSATVLASGSATVRASGSATVWAYDSATVEAYGSAAVVAYDSATVRAYDSATVRAYGSAKVRAYDSATVRAYDSAAVEASGSATVEASGSAAVVAYGSAYIQSYFQIECQIKDNAIYRVVSTNEIFLPKENMIAIKEI